MKEQFNNMNPTKKKKKEHRTVRGSFNFQFYVNILMRNRKWAGLLL